MIPALQTLLSVDCVDPTAMFNRNAGSDELRYMRQVPAYLTSLEYSSYNSDPSFATKAGPSPTPTYKTCERPQLTTF